MGVEVDWREVKDLVPPSSTINILNGALMQFISDLSKEHFDFLEPTEGLFSSKGDLTKHIYDRMQDVHPKTLLCTLPMSIIGDKSHKTLERFEHLVDFVDRSGGKAQLCISRSKRSMPTSRGETKRSLS
jgi:hypothetical protein